MNCIIKPPLVLGGKVMENLTVKILYSQATMGEPTLSYVTLTAVRRKTGPGGELRPAEPGCIHGCLQPAIPTTLPFQCETPPCPHKRSRRSSSTLCPPCSPPPSPSPSSSVGWHQLLSWKTPTWSTMKPPIQGSSFQTSHQVWTMKELLRY